MIADVFRSRFLLASQFGAVVVAFALLASAPPASGRLLLIPTGAAAAARLLPLALANGALIVGRGPIAGSVVVDGARARLAGAFGSTDVVILAAPQAGCGGVPDAGA